MPFDPTPNQEQLDAIVPNFAPGREGLKRLAFALRHPETWPKGFIWDYSDCRRCAIGLAFQLWLKLDEQPVQWDPKSQNPQYIHNQGWASMMARRFALSFQEAKRIFIGSYSAEKTRRTIFGRVKVSRQNLDHENVTPEMVATNIDKYLASH